MLFVAETLHFNDQYDGWAQGPPLLEAREYHACAIIPRTSYEDGSTDVIVVAGGRDVDEVALTSTELLVNGQWMKGPDLPKPLSEPTLVSLGNAGVVLMGGTVGIYGPSSDSIYRLACGEAFDDCEWMELEVSLMADRYGHSVIGVNEDLSLCNLE